MNSNQDPEKLETLRKLMALKRHEQPPPEYLNQLSNSIISRIERGEGRPTMWDWVAARITLRPGLAYAFGLTVCGALGMSAVYMIREEAAQTAAASGGLMVKRPVPAVTYASEMDSATPPLHVANWLRNTNPAEAQSQISLFDHPHTAMTVSYQPGN